MQHDLSHGPRLCECGCGRLAPVKDGRHARFVHGHNRRKRLPEAPPKLCECGCGGFTEMAQTTNRDRGVARGQRQRFIFGHQNRGKKQSPETIEKRRRSGPDHGQWRGGVSLHGRRTKIHVGRDHPMASKAGYAFEYRLVMADALGRPLLASEVVHHIDLDETNNAIENLALCNASQHRRIHSLIDRGEDPRRAVEIMLGGDE